MSIRRVPSLVNFMTTGNFTWYDTRNVTGTTLRDRGPGAFNATLSTTIPQVPGPYAGMLGLSFASAPTMVCPTGYTTGDFSISYWVYFINKANSGGTSTYQYIVTGGRLQVHQYFGNANIAYNSGGTVAFSQTGGVWTHLTYVYTTSGTTNITVFQNGIQVASANTGINAAGNFTFGQGSGLTFISYLADIRIVPFKLTANQALLLYQSYLNGSWASTGNVGILRLSNQFAAGQTITAFAATGAVQTFVVPGGVSSIRFFMWGAGGNNQNQNGTIVNSVGGGSGAYLDGTIFVSPGTTLYIIVGVNGGTTLAQGGAGASTFSGSGGGFSGIFTGSPASGNVIAIAGGGGGSGVNGGGNGGGGGYPSGGGGTGNNPGGGGSQSAGGSLNGTQLQGGATGAQGGGGGGGWYGGGAAVNQNNGGGGGGGSSTYTAAVISPVSINGNTGISTNGSNTPAPNEASPYWSSPAGRSAASGRVVLVYSAAPAILRLQPFFSPNALSGLNLWLDAADSSTITTSGSSVTQWRDKSSSGYTFTQGNTSLSPKYGLNTMNGLNVITSQGSQYLQITNWSQNFTTATFFYVLQPTNSFSTWEFIGVLMSPQVTGTPYIYIELFGLTSPNLFTATFSSYNNGGFGGNLGSGSITGSTYLMTGLFRANTSTNSANVNGTPFGGYNFTGTANFSSSASNVTLYTAGYPGNSKSGLYSEIIMFNRVLSVSEYQQVEGYLAWKWGLQANLPSNHPYRMRKP